ncbi:MAG TPA: UDP-N-acetylmuramoyl-L-alanyl-D-glutamate--2,6-diaminopimelate ligase [Candidatus Tumulicola sp.]|jgi:UDP-N-acetylmuramoyl-L-alanyl-D-glutamate--2,6-diaminopimelate ligase
MADRLPVELSRLTARLPAERSVLGDSDRLVTSIESDSRAVRPGTLFVALRGERTDGHAFVAQAIARGAAAIVVEEPAAAFPEATVVTVADSRRALSALSAAFYEDPSRSLDTVGVTGTNGKTTTVQMVRAILDGAARPCGTIGTVGAEFRERRWTLAQTTPLPPELHGLLAAMRDAGAVAVAMEVSSHALALGRVDDVTFRVAALTNVTRDHLDFHSTLEAYAAAKRRLFEMAQSAVLNVDDPLGARWARELRARGVPTITYGERNGDLRPVELAVTPDGSRFAVDGTVFEVRLPGRFNALNALAAIGIARSLGLDDAAIAPGLAHLDRVPGRMERFGDGGVDVVVDYAHTPDALERVLQALRETVSGSVFVVFGCGGDRDRGKRPEMGAVAARYADRVYVTSDNPRTEDPRAIAAQIVAGISGGAHAVELDRRTAIETAITQACPGDAVLIAGKGHEVYQIVGREAIEFDDAVVARRALRLRGAIR